MTAKRETLSDVFESGFIHLLCKGDEDAADMLMYLMDCALRVYYNMTPLHHVYEGTPRFKAAQDKLAELGLSTFDPATNQWTVYVGELWDEYRTWARLSRNNTGDA